VLHLILPALHQVARVSILLWLAQFTVNGQLQANYSYANINCCSFNYPPVLTLESQNSIAEKLSNFKNQITIKQIMPKILTLDDNMHSVQCSSVRQSLQQNMFINLDCSNATSSEKVTNKTEI